MNEFIGRLTWFEVRLVPLVVEVELVVELEVDDDLPLDDELEIKVEPPMIPELEMLAP